MPSPADEGDLVAKPGQCLLVVAEKVPAVALVPLLVVVLPGVLLQNSMRGL